MPDRLSIHRLSGNPYYPSWPTKTTYDVLLDSLTKCSLLAPWAAFVGRKIHTSGRRESMRCLLVQTLSKITSTSWKKLLIETSWLTPDDSEAVHLRAAQLLHEAQNVWWPYVQSGLTSLRAAARGIRLLPVNTTSEEEAFCNVRSSALPRHNHDRPTDTYPCTLFLWSC